MYVFHDPSQAIIFELSSNLSVVFLSVQRNLVVSLVKAILFAFGIFFYFIY